ncbi:hypothetical protein SAMN06265376_104318 [Dokdonia pacifica]|uniref:Uncharacterized protein n=2 Tax=Dokdonia pacifica TaxID=1627892 RepID=A0A239AC59_9FLAO|nr:hypothetical protein SAMN06265376_104318 [Dokdonia pacifica]
MTIVKNNWKLLTGIVLVIVLVSTYLFSDDNLQTTTFPDLLEQENKELFVLNTALDTKVQDLKIQAENLQEIINEKDQQIYHLKQTLDENINRINNYSVLELERFFARLKTDSIPH